MRHRLLTSIHLSAGSTGCWPAADAAAKEYTRIVH